MQTDRLQDEDPDETPWEQGPLLEKSPRWPLAVVATSLMLTVAWIGFIVWQACRAAVAIVFG